jgi:hypothetical protein
MENKAGSLDFEKDEEKIISLSRNAYSIGYPIYWEGLRILKHAIALLIDEATVLGDSLEAKQRLAILMLVNRSIQHLESMRLITERGLYGDAFVLTRSLMSDLSMMQYLRHNPQLVELFLNEKQDDYQENKIFSKAFNETTIEKFLVKLGLKPFTSSFRVLSKTSHASSFGSQLFGSKGKDNNYHFTYGPKFQVDKGLLLTDLIVSGPYDLLSNILDYRTQTEPTKEWLEVHSDAIKLQSRVEIFGTIAKEVVNKLLSKTDKDVTDIVPESE